MDRIHELPGGSSRPFSIQDMMAMLGVGAPRERPDDPETPAAAAEASCADCASCKARRKDYLRSLLTQPAYAQLGAVMTAQKAVECLEAGSFMGSAIQARGAVSDLESEPGLKPFKARTAEAAELCHPLSRPWFRPALLLMEVSAAALMAGGGIKEIRQWATVSGPLLRGAPCPSQFAFLMGDAGPEVRHPDLFRPHVVAWVDAEGCVAQAHLHGHPSFSLSFVSRVNARRLSGNAIVETRAVDMCCIANTTADFHAGTGRSPPTARLAKSGPAALQMALPAVRYMRSLLRVCVNNYFAPAPGGHVPAPPQDPRDIAEVKQSLRRLSDICCASGLPRMAQIMVQNAIGIVASCEVMPLGLKEEKAAGGWTVGTPQLDWSAASAKAREGGKSPLDEANRARLLEAWSHVAAGLAPELIATWQSLDMVLGAAARFRRATAAAAAATPSSSGAKPALPALTENEVGLALALLAALPTVTLATAFVLQGSELNSEKERGTALRRAGLSDKAVQDLAQCCGGLDRYTQAMSWASSVMCRYARDKKLGSTDPPIPDVDADGIPFDLQAATTPGNIAWLITDAFAALPRLAGGLDSIRMLRDELRDAGGATAAAAAANAAAAAAAASNSTDSGAPAPAPSAGSKPSGVKLVGYLVRAILDIGRGFDGFGRSGRVAATTQVVGNVSELLVVAIESGAVGPWDLVEELPKAFVSLVRQIENKSFGQQGLSALFSLVLSHPRARARLIQVLQAEAPGRQAPAGVRNLLESCLSYFKMWTRPGREGGPQDHLAPYIVNILGPATPEGAAQPVLWQPIGSVGQGREYVAAVYRAFVNNSLDNRTNLRSVPLMAAACVLRVAQGLFLKATRRPAKGALTAEGVRSVSDAVGLVSDSAPLVHLAADLAETYGSGRAEGPVAGAAPRFGSDQVRYGVSDFLVAFGEFLLAVREVCAEQQSIAVRSKKAGNAKGGAKKGAAQAQGPEAPIVSLEVWKEKYASVVRLGMMGPAALWADTVAELGRAWAFVRGAQRRALVAATAATAATS